MLHLWKLHILLGLLMQLTSKISAASTTFSVHPSRQFEPNNAYLPSYTTAEFVAKSSKFLNSLSPQSTQKNLNFQTMPQLSSTKSIVHRFSANTNGLQTPYVPAPSGVVSSTIPRSSSTFQYSTPQASQKILLPSLIPTSVLDQLPVARKLSSSSIQNTPSTTFLTINRNSTIEAARLLASTLLEASGEQPLNNLNGIEFPNALQDPNKLLNSTDIVVVKSQKNAYLIPMQLTKGGADPQRLREIYDMRDQLPKAYTVNQFIFIIKPEKINFLNKLV